MVLIYKDDEESCEENVDVSLDERNQFYHQKMGQSSIKIKLDKIVNGQFDFGILENAGGSHLTEIIH